MTSLIVRASIILTLLVGCGGETTEADAGDTDGGSLSDAGPSDIDAGPSDTDAGPDATDAGPDATDAGPDVTDAGRDATDAGPGATDAGMLACTPGEECPDYAATLSAAPRGSTSLDNCVVQLHQADCCGATRAYGVNHAARETLCPAEASCVATYPTPSGCTDTTITTDSGDTTMDIDEVKLRIVDPTPCSFDASVTCYTCETFVCTTGACRGAPGVAGGCG